MPYIQDQFHPDYVDRFLDRSIMQVAFDKGVAGVILQGKPSFTSRAHDPFMDMVASYFSNNKDSCSPVGHLLIKLPDMMEKHGFPHFGWWSISFWPDELIEALMPGANKLINNPPTYSRRFLSDLDRVHAEVFSQYKRAKGKINFNKEFIEAANKVARGWCLKGIEYDENLYG